MSHGESQTVINRNRLGLDRALPFTGVSRIATPCETRAGCRVNRRTKPESRWMSRTRLLGEIGGGALSRKSVRWFLHSCPPKKEKHGNETHWNAAWFGIASVKEPSKGRAISIPDCDRCAEQGTRDVRASVGLSSASPDYDLTATLRFEWPQPIRPPTSSIWRRASTERRQLC